MTTRRSLLPATATLALATIVAPAASFAAPGPGPTFASDPIAEKLFRDGKDLMKAGKVAEACAAFDASEKTEHNVATAMNLADCRERTAQLATAWALYLQVVGEARADAMLTRLAEVARSRADAIEPHLSYLVINVPEEHHVLGLIVWRDHQALDAGAWNRAIPVDGGSHLIEARAPGHEAWSTVVTVAPRDDRQSIEVPAFTDLVRLVPPGDGVLSPPSSASAPLPPAPPSRVLPIALVSSGAAAVIGSALMWRHATNLHETADETCPLAGCSSSRAATANDLQRDARRWAIASNVGWIAGGVAIAGGAALYLFHGPTRRDATALRITPRVGDATGVVVTGGF
jgi:hypothetical protein